MPIAQLSIPEEMIDLGVGQPAVDLLPLAILRQSAAHRLADGNPLILQYGTEQGNAHFRKALAEFLSTACGVPTDADGLFVTAGASQGLDLICSLFTRPGDTVFVEEPSYFLALRIFADHRLRAVGIPVDDHGMDIEALAARLRRERPAFVYTIPAFQNPAGVTLSARRRQALIELSRQYDFPVVADEVYHLLAYNQAPPAPMVRFAGAGHVLSLGSFSKILAPGLRLGWIQTSGDMLRRLTGCGLLDSGGGLNPFTSAVVQSTIELGLLQDNLDTLRRTYARRAQALVEALREFLPAAVRFRSPDGGFFIWARLPEGCDALALLDGASRQGVRYQPGQRFSSNAGLKRHMRLSFSYYGRERLQEGARRLGGVIHSHLDAQRRRGAAR